MKTTCAMLGTAIVLGAALLASSPATAEASPQRQQQGQQSSSDRWCYHCCYKCEEDADRECRRLERNGWECEVRCERGKFCVYKRRMPR